MYENTKKVQTVLELSVKNRASPKMYENTKKVQSYEKGTKLQKRYKITKKVRSYE
jgi:hypothetical protein